MKVLLADDDKFIRVFISSKLKKFGFEVDTSSDGEETLSKMKSEKPDIVLLDMVMPKKDGFQVLEEASKDSSISKIPVIVVSSLSQEADLKRISELGAKGQFDKTSSDYEPLRLKILELTN